MPYAVIYALIGYLSGSVLYAEVFCRIFGRKNAIEQSRDANPGTANAFLYGGFWCGICTLIFDMAKGFVPVYAYVHMTQMNLAESNGLALVLAAPVAGHIFPVWHHFKGGKGIAATSGVALSLLLFPKHCWVFAVFGLITFASVTLISKYVSLGSLVFITLFLIEFLAFGAAGWLPLTGSAKLEAYGILICLTVLAYIRHRGNIGRLMHGTERKIGHKA
mgnify:CR=1 FL=1